MSNDQIIKAVEVRGFQSWVEGYAEFTPGLNVLYGASDEGKSAFLRALRWCLLNQVRGGFAKNKNWKMSNKASMFIDVQFGDESWVSREQSNSVNQYQIDTISQPLVALRKDLPKEVGDVIKMSDVNFQQQKTWFLIDQTAGTVAHAFNKLVNLEMLDTAVKEANSRIRSQNSKLTKLLQDEEDLSNEIEQESKVLKRAEKSFEKLDQLNTKIQNLEYDYSRVLGILQNAKKITDRLDRYKDLPRGLAKMHAISKTDYEISGLNKKYNRVYDMLETIYKIKDRLCDSDGLPEAIGVLSNILDLEKRIEHNQNEYRLVSKLVIKIIKLKSAIKNADISLKEAERKKHDILKAKGICPLCQQSIN
jgi:exonuclease SbcC